jgi:hypothetical protein
VQIGQAVAGTINFEITQQVLVQRTEAKRKNWKSLNVVNYLADDHGEARVSKYAFQLCLFLNRVFKDEGYTSFTGLMEIHRNRGEDGSVAQWYRLFTHQAKFVGAMGEAWRYLWFKGDEAKETHKRQMADEMNRELKMLAETWSLNVSLPLGETLRPVEFTYDPDARHIGIGPPGIASSNPGDYPEKLRRTSELLAFAGTLQDHTFSVVDLELIHSFYPLFKLWHQIMDKHSWTLSNVRVNIQDPEDWDYHNPDADREIGNYERTHPASQP